MAFSIRNPGMLWAINDGGNAPQLFLLNNKAEIIMTCDLDISNRDWEAISVYCDSLGKSMILLGDIGDNKANKENKLIYRIEEPVYTSSYLRIDTVESMNLPLPDRPKDMEAMILDPVSKKLYLFSKREDEIYLYCVERPFSDQPVIEYVTKLPFTFVVDASISLDGDEVIVKDYRNIYYWERNKQESIEKTLLQTAQILPHKREMQGESVTFASDGRGYYTLSESVVIRAKLYYYRRVRIAGVDGNAEPVLK